MFYRIIVAITLLINAVSDFKTRTIFSIYFLGAAAFGIFVSDYKMAAILTIVSCMFITDNILPKCIGAGDIDAILLLWSAIGLKTIGCLFFASIIALGWAFIRKDKQIPFVGCIAIAYVINLIQL